MLGINPVLILGIGLLAGDPGGEPTVAPEAFQRWFEQSAAGELRIPPDVSAKAREYRYVFVGGLHSELIRGYFTQNSKELRARGVPKRAIHEIYPSSKHTFADNIGEIRKTFFEIAASGPERLVVIAHSRGACDTLAFALQNPEFVRDHIEAMFLVQGAFGGSGVADYIMGEGVPIDEEMPTGHRFLAGLLVKVEHFLMKRGMHGGLPDLTRKTSRLFWEKVLADHAEAIPIVGPRTFYIQSQVHPTLLRKANSTAGWYLHTYYGPNDGMVAFEDQRLPGLGTSLATLNIGHQDLTHRANSARSPRKLRKALMQSIVMAVGRPEPHAALPAAQIQRTSLGPRRP